MPEGPLGGAFVTIHPDLDAFEAELRAKLEEATGGQGGDVKINVDADTGAADAKLEATKAEADRTGENKTIRVDADTAGADANLLATKAAADSAAGSASGGGIGGLAAAGLALGPALVPAAAAAAAGIGALASLTGIAAVGIGSFAVLAIPAFQGVGKEVQTISKDQTALNDAITQADKEKALKKLQEDYSKIPPEQRPVVQGILDLKQALDDVSKSIQPQIFGAFQSFLNAGKTLLPQLGPPAQQAALAFTDIGNALNRAFQSQGFHEFMGWVTGNVRGALDSIAIAIGNLAKGFGGLLEAFAPLVPGLEGGMDRITASFARWAQNLGGSQGFQNFLQYFHDNGAAVAKLIKDVATAVETIVRDSAGFGAIEIRALDDFAKAINAIASVPGLGPVIVDIGFLALAIGKLSQIGLIASGLAAFGRALQSLLFASGAKAALAGLPEEITAVGAASSTASGEMAGGGFLTGFASKIKGGLAAALGGVFSASGLLGAVGVGVITASAAAIGSLLISAFSKSAEQKIEELVPGWAKPIFHAFVEWSPLTMLVRAVMPAIEDFFGHMVPSAISGATGAIWNAVSGAWQKVESITTTIWNAISGFFEHWWHALILVFGPIGVIVDFVTTNWHAIANITTTVFNAVASFLSGVWNAITGAITAAVGAVSRAIQGAWTFVQGVTTVVWAAISGFLSGVWNAISGAASAVFNAIRSVITSIWGAIQGSTSGTWSAISGFLSGIWGGISGTASSVFGAIKSVITTTMDEIGTAIHTVWDGMSSFFSGVWDGIKTAFSTGVDAVGTVVNPFIDVADKALSLLGVNINIPDLPHLAEGGSIGGGFVTRGPTAVVGEGKPAWPEFVIPTDPAYRERAQSLYADLGGKLGGGGCGGACGMAAGGLLSSHEMAAYAGAGVPMAGFGLHTIVGGAERIGGDIISGGKAILHGIGDVAGEAAAVVRGAAGDVLRTLAGSIGFPWPVPPVFEGTIPAFANKGVQGIIDLVAGKQAAKSAAGGGSGIGGSGPAVTSAACGDLVAQGLALPGANAGFGAACMQARLMNESGCNPGQVVNNWDSNAAAGHPSVGIAQFVPSTFASVSCPGCTDINNPLCQICASSHCSPGNCGHGGYGCASGGILGLANGGIVNSPTLSMIGERGPEAVVPLGQGGAFGGNVTIDARIVFQGDVTDNIDARIQRAHAAQADRITRKLGLRGVTPAPGGNLR